jgi:hypothetical protein
MVTPAGTAPVTQVNGDRVGAANDCTARISATVSTSTGGCATRSYTDVKSQVRNGNRRSAGLGCGTVTV